MASREDQLKRLSIQALKLVEDYSDKLVVDMSESFEPFFQEWESVHELAGIPVDEVQKQTLGNIRRAASFPPPMNAQGDIDDVFPSDIVEAAPMRRLRVRSLSFGSQNSLDVRDRKRSYEASMDTMWTSSSTFSINIDNGEDDFDENAGILMHRILGNGNEFVGGSEPNLLEARSRGGTLSEKDYPKEEIMDVLMASVQVSIIEVIGKSKIFQAFQTCKKSGYYSSVHRIM